MDKITAKAIVEITDTSKSSNWLFTDDWNFKIDKFEFKYLNDKEVEVTFYFYAKLRSVENGIPMQLMPGENAGELEEPQEELETILDLIALQVGVGIKIRKDSYYLSYPGGESLRVSNDKKIKQLDKTAIQKQFENIKKDKSANKGVMGGLRCFHRSLWYDDPTEKFPKLYSVFEQIFSEGSGGRMVSEKELQEIEQFFKAKKYDPIKQEILLKRIYDTPAKSINEALVEKLKLMNSEGDVPEENVREMLKSWRSTRGKASHGTGLSKRDEELDLMLWDLESTAEAFLYSSISPSLIEFLLFKESDLEKGYLDRRDKLLSHLDEGYLALPLRHDEVWVYEENLPHTVTDNSSVYLISHDKIKKISKDTISAIDIQVLDNKLQEFVKKIQEKLNK